MTIDDATLDAALGHAQFRTDLVSALRRSGVLTPLEKMEREVLRGYVSQALDQIKAAHEAQQSVVLPDEVIDSALANPDMREAMIRVLKSNDIDTAPEDLPRESLRELITAMVRALETQNPDKGSGT